MNEIPTIGRTSDKVVQHAIETVYRGYEFRSRLEAKWAAFFDLCDWTWAYEPVDLNGWIPDFALGEHPVYVEVKPFFENAEWDDQLRDIERAKPDHAVVCLGADATWWSKTDLESPQIGWIIESLDDLNYVEALHFGISEGNGKLGLYPPDGTWQNAIWKFSGEHTHKQSRVELSKDEVEFLLVRAWARACNISKWIPLRKDSNK